MVCLQMNWISRIFRREPVAETPPSLRPSTTITLLQQSIVPADWTNSQPHLAMLQRFVSMRDGEIGVPEHWQPMFGVTPRKVVEALVKGKILEEITLVEKIQFCHTGADLRKLLAARGLKVSGKKAEQAQRLLDADAEGMLQLCGKRKVLTCSSEAKQAVAAWVRERNDALVEAADKVIAALLQRRFKDALELADAYRKTRFEVPVQPGQDAITIKTPQRSVEERIADLARIFTLRPKILKDLPSDDWEGLYLNHCLWKLIGTEFLEKCMPGFTGLGVMDEATVARMLSFYSGHSQNRENWRVLGIKKASVSCCNSGSCDPCLALDGKTYQLSKLPELPYERCICALGCRCLYMAEINFD